MAKRDNRNHESPDAVQQAIHQQLHKSREQKLSDEHHGGVSLSMEDSSTQSIRRCLNPAVVVIGRDDIQVPGNSVKTVDELIKLLAEKMTASVDLHNDAGGDYERIGKVIYAMSRKGVKIEAIDGRAVRREHMAPAPG